MSYNLTSERFVECLLYLKENQLISSFRQFAIALDFHPQSLNEILKKKRNVTLSLLTKACEVYRLSPMFLHTGEGPMIREEKSTDNVEPLHELNSEILHISSEMQSNYCEQPKDEELLNRLNRFSLPDYKYRSGPHRCFDIKCDSMEPSLYHGDKVVCTMLPRDDWERGIVDNFVYVVIIDSNVYVKRVGNKLKHNNELELSSDNSFFETFTVAKEEIKEVWSVNTKISPFMSSPSNQRNAFNVDIDNMKSTIDQQNQVIKTLNSTLEKFLKQNRAR